MVYGVVEIGHHLVWTGLWSGRNWSSFGLNWFTEWLKLVSIWFGNGAKLAFWYDQNWLAFGLKLFWKRLKLVCFWNGWSWWTFSLNWCWSWIRLWVEIGSKLNVWMVKIRSKKMVQKLTKKLVEIWMKLDLNAWNWPEKRNSKKQKVEIDIEPSQKLDVEPIKRKTQPKLATKIWLKPNQTHFGKWNRSSETFLIHSSTFKSWLPIKWWPFDGTLIQNWLIYEWNLIGFNWVKRSVKLQLESVTKIWLKPNRI